MRKILVVSFGSDQKYTGGQQCSLRNYQSIVNIFGAENTIQYTIKPNINKKSVKTILKRVVDIFKGYMGGLNDNIKSEISTIVCDNAITDVFIDSSLLGTLAKTIHKLNPNIRIYTFFHNIEYEFVRDSVLVNRDYIRFYWLILAKLNEKLAVKYSDKIISLNKRDADAIYRYYNRTPDIIIPITLKDKLISDFDKQMNSENSKALFIGSYFFGNVQGVKWFCSNVLPYTNIKLTIVGASMNLLNNELQHNPKIEIYSDVPDLDVFYRDADFVILPIMSGSGMKVKTAESLMHGKFIIGTDEAFRGYDISSREGIVCNSAKEFIEAINNMNLPYKFNQPSRDLYKTKYSFDSSIEYFKRVFELQ